MVATEAPVVGHQCWFLYRSGFLRTIYSYGAVGTYRVLFVYGANMERMLAAAGGRVPLQRPRTDTRRRSGLQK